MCFAGCDSHVQKSKKGGVGGLHDGTIWEAEEGSMSDGYEIGTGSCGDKEWVL